MMWNEQVKEFCAKQIRRLAGQDFFYPDPEILAELARTLVEYAKDEAHIERMVNIWIRRTRKPLHPSDVEELAFDTSTEATTERLSRRDPTRSSFPSWKIPDDWKN